MMKDKIRVMFKEKRDLFMLLGIVLVLSLVIFSIYYLNNIPFEYGGDLKRQYYPFFAEFEEMIKYSIKTGTLPFYSWNTFLGTNYWASKTFYLLGDVFAYITVLIPANFFDSNMIVLILKNCVAATTFYYLLNEFGYKSKTKIIFSICYVFSAWMMCFIEHTMFISFYAWVPLYFLGIERYLKKRKFGLFSIAVVLLFCTNYYLMFPLSMLTPIYYTYRYYNIVGSLRGFIKTTAKLIGIYLLSVGVIAIFMLPTISYISNNERIGDFYVYWQFWIIESYYHLIQSLFIPNQLYLFSPDNLYDTLMHNTRELAIFSGTITTLLIPQFLSDKNKKFRYSTLLLYLILTFIIFTPISNIVVMGFGDLSFRWTFIIIIINILTAARYFDSQLINKKVLIGTTFVAVCVNLFALPLMFYQKGILPSFSTNHFMYQISILSSIVFTIFLVVLLAKTRYKGRVLLVLVCIELTACNYFVFADSLSRNKPSYDVSDGVTKVLQDYDRGLNNELRAYDELNSSQFYRVFVDFDTLFWSYSYNANLFYQLPSTMTYDTTLAPSLTKTAEWFPELNVFGVKWAFNIKEKNYIDFLNIKYAIVTDPSQLPHERFTLIDNNFRWGLLLYQNDNYRSVGVTYTKIIRESEFTKNLNSSVLLDTVISMDDDFEALSDLVGSSGQKELENISYFGNQLHGTVTTDDHSFMVMSIPYDSGWKVLINEKTVETYNVNGGFMGFEINEGYNKVDMYFVPSGFKAGVVISVISIFTLVAMWLYQCKKSKIQP